MMDRKATIREIRTALKERSGKPWSVTGGKGTAWGWLTIDAPPARRTWSNRPLAHNPGGNLPGKENWEEYDTGKPDGCMSPDDRAELGRLLGLDGPVHDQGVSIPAGGDYWQEYIDRAEGRKPEKCGVPYWD